MRLSDNCTNCGLCETRNLIVWGAGPHSSSVMFIAEGPGEWEDNKGTPFYYKAPAGREMDRLLGVAGLDRSLVYLSNSVKCRPPSNRDPSPDEVQACRQWLLMELAIIRPKFLVTVGAVSTRNILGSEIGNMETVHGIPFDAYLPEIDLKLIVIPVYHPAAGLRSPESALKCVMDFAAVGRVVRGLITPAHYVDPFAGAETYGVLETPKEVKDTFGHVDTIGLDTETLDWNYTPFMISASAAPGSGYVIDADNKSALSAFAEIVANPEVLTLIHNSLFDLFVLERLKIKPATVRDTMVMAYLLQSEPQGLKPLAFRYWGMHMKDYEDMVASCSSTLAEAFLKTVMDFVWPDPDPILEIKPGNKIHVRQPRNISKIVQKMFADLEKHKIGPEDLWKRWHRLDMEETGRDLVENILGDMPQGNLSMLPRAEAVYYAARDADATVRVYPYLWRRIEVEQLTGVFRMDMDIIPMVKDMMATGMLPDRQELKKLGNLFEDKMLALEAEIQKHAGGVINVGSPLQVAELLFEKLGLEFKHKHNKVSTNDKVLSRITAQHPVVPLIRNWRSYQKLKTTYADKLPRFIQEDGRIHAKISTTRTSTGRLAASKPNIMNQPTRSEDGKAIRKAFFAVEGAKLVSNDLSQIEMRVLADQSGDKRLIQIFRDGLDLHSMTAHNIFKVPIEELDEMKHRYPSKRVGFGVVYGITAEGLQEQLLMIGLDPEYWTVDRCQQLIDNWFALYSDVEGYMGDLVAFALRHGYVVDMFGRRRYLPTIKSSSRQSRQEAVRQAGNMPIQSGAAGIFKMAMKNLTPVYLDFQKQGYICRPVVPIHDDLVFEVSDEIIPIWIAVCQDIMENSVRLKVPILSEAKVGQSWGGQEKYKGAK